MLRIQERFRRRLLTFRTVSTAGSVAFYDIMEQLTKHGKNPRGILPLDIPRLDPIVPAINCEEHNRRGMEKYILLNNDQKFVVDKILNAAEDPQGQCYFIDGPGGSGKIFVYATIYHLATSIGHKVINVAWTGTAANLLPGGRTVTSTFRLVVQDDNRSSSSKRQSAEATLLQNNTMIIWDETPRNLSFGRTFTHQLYGRTCG